MANAKLDVDIGGFISNISSAKNILKGLDAEMKATDATFKATGNAEQQLANKTKTLNSQIQIQKGIADQAAQALKAMTDAGVDPADAAYQRLYATMMNATAGMNNAQAELNGLSGSAQGAAASADQLTTSVQGIGKKISLDQVISGIDRIKTGLEDAAKKAIQFGEDLWNTIMDSARRADDTATMAEMYEIPLDRFLKMQRLVGSGMDTTVDSMLSGMDKLNKGIGKETAATIEALKDLGIEYKRLAGDEGVGEYVTRDATEVFWEAGQALLAMGDAFDKEAAATALFGKSWKELRPLFNTYKSLEEYNKALDEMTVNDEETIRDLAALNDAVSNLERSWTVLKDEVLGALAPALKSGADAISGLLDSLTEYLKSEDGQKLLDDLGTAVSGLFDDLGKIDPEQVVSGFTSVITAVTDGVKWLVDNAETVKGILGTIVGAWALSNVAIAGLEITKLIQGIQGLAGAGAAAAAGEAGAAAGAAWGSGFAGAVAKAIPLLAPFLIGAETIKNDIEGQAKDQAAAEKRTAAYLETANKVLSTGDDNLMLATAALLSLGDTNQAINVDALNNIAQKWADWNDWSKNDKSNPIWEALTDSLSDETYERFGDLMTNVLTGGTFDQRDTTELLQQVMQEISDAADDMMPEVPVDLTVPSDAAQQLSAMIGTVLVHCQAVLDGVDGEHANGLPYVPYDGYLARLHKGERVVPAREVQSRSFNSNLYVESMYMNNGTDAAGLASAMAAAQQRMMSGFGSC